MARSLQLLYFVAMDRVVPLPSAKVPQIRASGRALRGFQAGPLSSCPFFDGYTPAFKTAPGLQTSLKSCVRNGFFNGLVARPVPRTRNQRQHESVVTATDQTRNTRLAGLDLARALALIGMLMVHVGPTNAEGATGWFYALPHGRASVLFMVVAGVGVSLMTTNRQDGARRMLWRALLLLPLGLALQMPDGAPMIILPTYAVVFVLAIELVRLSTPVLLGIAATAALAGPAGFLLGYLRAPDVFANAPVSLHDPAGAILHGIVLSGPHPVVTWLFPFLAGVILGRLDLHDRTVQFLLVFVGGIAALILTAIGLVSGVILADALAEPGWLWLLRRDAHSQMLLWLWAATACATTVLGAALWLGERADTWLRPLTQTGRIALSFYVGHILALWGWPEALRADQPVEAAGIALAITVGTALAAMIWLRLFSRGPLEMLLQPPWWRNQPPGQAA